LKYKILDKTVRYFSEGYYRFEAAGLIATEYSPSTKLLIVARRHYIERCVSMPIVLKKDVKAAIELQLESSADEFYSFYHFKPATDGLTHVMIWQVPKSIIPKGVMMVVPETLLLGQTMATNQICSYLSMSNQSVLLAKTLTSISSISSHKPPSIELFSQGVGIEHGQVHTLDNRELANKLIEGMTALALVLITEFRLKRVQVQRDWNALLKPLVIPVSVSVLAYLGLSSAFISYQYHSLDSQIKSKESEINTVLALRSSIADLTDSIAAINESQSEAIPLWNTWLILFPYLEQGLQLKFIRFNGDKVFFSAVAPSAADILESLLDNPYATDAKFTTAVKKVGDMEGFIISFGFSDLFEAQSVEGGHHE
jgi:hypothetical protein